MYAVRLYKSEIYIAFVFFLLLIVKSSLQCATEIINLID